MSDCELLPGDVLIRRYVTDRTKFFEYFIHPYFTHAAFYLGNDKIVEAVGNEKDVQDEIQIATLSDSDWFDDELESFVVIRPYYQAELKTIQENLIEIANDLEYEFGLPDQGKKQFTCADLIFTQLQGAEMVEQSDTVDIVTPDYLYTVLSQSDEFSVVGFSLGTKK